MRLIFEHQTKEIQLFGEVSNLDMECLDKILELFPDYDIVKGSFPSTTINNPSHTYTPMPVPNPYVPDTVNPYKVTC